MRREGGSCDEGVLESLKLRLELFRQGGREGGRRRTRCENMRPQGPERWEARREVDG